MTLVTDRHVQLRKARRVIVAVSFIFLLSYRYLALGLCLSCIPDNAPRGGRTYHLPRDGTFDLSCLPPRSAVREEITPDRRIYNLWEHCVYVWFDLAYTQTHTYRSMIATSYIEKRNEIASTLASPISPLCTLLFPFSTWFSLHDACYSLTLFPVAVDRATVWHE